MCFCLSRAWNLPPCRGLSGREGGCCRRNGLAEGLSLCLFPPTTLIPGQQLPGRRSTECRTGQPYAERIVNTVHLKVIFLLPVWPQLFPCPPSLTHSIHLHFNLFLFPSPVSPLYFSLSSSRLFCAFSQKQFLLHYFSLFLSKFSEAHPPCSLLCYVILSLLSSVPFAPAVSSLCPLSSSLCHHFPHLTYSHSPQLKDPILLDLCCFYVLKQVFSNPSLTLPLVLLPASVPPPQSSVWHQLLSLSSLAPRAARLPLRGVRPKALLLLPSLFIACGQANIPPLCCLQPPVAGGLAGSSADELAHLHAASNWAGRSSRQP